jgi:aminobenzoyl-glutamate utilization protein B
MNKEKLTCVQNIDSIREYLYDLSLELWRNPETAFKEHYATLLLINKLNEAGFKVEENIAGIPTAFVAKWGTGRPVVGFLAEFDALPAQSQQVITYKQSIKEDAPGHACGHNLMAAAHLGAVIGLKNEMEANGLRGTIVFYGCPAEEVLTGKVFMARAGVFNDLDCALNFHPGAINGVSLRRNSGLNSVKFNFLGKSSHASTAPADGRSASDAAELMNVGANYLREHIHSDVRIHYVTTNGGEVPNIVPDFAQTWYFIRAPKREMVNEVYERLINVAQGAALMTGVNLKIDLQGGCYPTIQNKVLGEVVWSSLNEIGPENFTDEELNFASALNETCTTIGKPAYGIELTTPLHDYVLPLWGENTFAYNSTDIGDVSHIVPTVMFNTACFNTKANLHSWQVTACSGHSIGLKGMLYAAKVLALSGMRLLQEPSIIAKARHELDIELAGTSYKCPIPDDIFPPIS